MQYGNIVDAVLPLGDMPPGLSMSELLDAVGQVIDCEDPSFLEPTPIGPYGINIVDCIWGVPSPEPPLCQNNPTFQPLSASFPRTEASWQALDTQEHEAAGLIIDYSCSSNSALFQVTRSKKGSLCEQSTTIAVPSRFGAFRQSQLDQWNQRYQDLVEFRNTQGHCLVPLKYPEQPSLAHWIQRQRYQHRLKNDGKHSSMTDEREAALEDLGFIWDSHGATWEERWNELVAFKDQFGHCHVPAHYPENQKLSVWVKFQRQQLKLLSTDKRSRYGRERVNKLLHLGFVFNPRSTKKQGR
jgi:hypothetical protein